MILITTQTIQVTTTAKTTNFMPCVSDYVDMTASTTTPGTNALNTNGVSVITAVAAPTTSTQRQVKVISIYNADTITSTVNVAFYDGSTAWNLVSVPLLTGETLRYTFEDGWRVLQSTGGIKTAATTFKPSYGTANQALTITLASLTTTSARQSTAVSNTATLYEDVMLFFMIKTGASSTSTTGYLSVYGFGSVDGSTYTESAGASDAAITLTVPPNAVLLAQINAVANATTYRSGPVSFCRMMGFDRLPAQWGVIIVNKTGGTLDSTAGNHAVLYQGINGVLI